VVRELLKAMRMEERVTVYEGAAAGLKDVHAPAPSDAASFIVKEAMREDTRLPLYVACGAGLTNIASACLMEPKIAQRIRLIWIGGPEHAGLAVPPPGGQKVEYNLGIDVAACQVVFNHSDIPVWQVPRDAYRQTLVSHAELRHRMNTSVEPAKFLMGRLEDLLRRAKGSLGETYVLGDSPLVLLTALQSSWEVDPSSSRYVTMKAPKISDKGQYEDNPDGREIRVYTHLDTRVMFEDFYAKVALFGRTE
jgi:inosine-uridine nucleoside N-ribohydrolase